MGIVMGDSVGHRRWSRVMGSANTNDQSAKVFRGSNRPQGREESHSAGEYFGDGIELEPRWETFGDAIEDKIWKGVLGGGVLRSIVYLSNKQIMT
jgi:hypothetical protein